MHPKVGFLLSHGALGDTITSLPAIRFARATHNAQAMKMIVWTRRDLVPLLEILLPGCDVQPLEMFHEETERTKNNIGYPFAMNSSIRNTVTRNKMDMVLFGYATLLDTQPPSPEWMSYPTAPLGPRAIAEPYIVIAANGTAPNRIIPPRTVTAIAEWALARGLKPVFLGKREAEVPVTIVTGEGPTRQAKKSESTSRLAEIDAALMERCLDLREKTGILEARDILGHAEAVVGIDGGLLHLAGTTDVPIVYAVTTVHPAHRSIMRHGELNWRVEYVEPKNLKCAGCQSKWTLVFGHPFTTCAYDDFLCVDHLDPADLTKALESLTSGDKP
jgi:ADP-heptose:LPS heptosyltransferase